jgi:hypothetical protein
MHLKTVNNTTKAHTIGIIKIYVAAQIANTSVTKNATDDKAKHKNKKKDVRIIGIFSLVFVIYLNVTELQFLHRCGT